MQVRQRASNFSLDVSWFSVVIRMIWMRKLFEVISSTSEARRIAGKFSLEVSWSSVVMRILWTEGSLGTYQGQSWN